MDERRRYALRATLLRLAVFAAAVYFAWRAIGHYRDGSDFNAAWEAMLAVGFMTKMGDADG